jgi:hypothetical protein
MPDVTCDLNVDDERVWLRFDDDTQYRAPVRNDPLVRLLVKRLDRFVTHHDPGVTRGVTGYEDADLKLLGAALFNILFGQQAERMMPGKKKEDPRVAVPTSQTLENILVERLSKHDKNSPFRIALEFEGDLLGTFPWEFMFVGDPDGKGGYFLSEKATLYRVVRLPERLPGPARSPSRNLKIVVAWALPPSLERLTSTESADKVISNAFQATASCSVQEWKEVHWKDFEKKFNAIPSTSFMSSPTAGATVTMSSSPFTSRRRTGWPSRPSCRGEETPTPSSTGPTGSGCTTSPNC